MMVLMTLPQNLVDPPLPASVADSPESRARQRGIGALQLAVFALLLELSPAVIAATGGRGPFFFSMMGLSGGFIAGAAVIRSYNLQDRVKEAQWAFPIGIAGVIVMVHHAPICAAVTNFFFTVGRWF